MKINEKTEGEYSTITIEFGIDEYNLKLKRFVTSVLNQLMIFQEDNMKKITEEDEIREKTRLAAQNATPGQDITSQTPTEENKPISGVVNEPNERLETTTHEETDMSYTPNENSVWNENPKPTINQQSLFDDDMEDL